MIKYFTFIIFFLSTLTLNATEFTVASYNVENLFDLKYDGTEYKEYKPKSKYWNKKILQIKLNHISKVINDLDASIVALQEIESKQALNLLLQQIPQYKYSCFLKNYDTAVGVAIISKYKIIDTQTIKIDTLNDYTRPILKATIKIDNKTLTIFNNHWRSKKVGEAKRVKYAVALKNIIDLYNSSEDYILIGDFNSNYNEWQTFQFDKKLNNTYGITGINHILNTMVDNQPILLSNIKQYTKQVHYNLWYELTKQNRFSYKFRSQNSTPDNIIISKGLLDNKNISYIPHSFKVFKPNYLYHNHKINKWDRYKGYSDHLPIVASFTTSNIIHTKYKQYTLKSSTINHLYNIEYLNTPLTLNNVVVIYKNKNSAIIKQVNNKAIYLYNCASNLELGYKYSIQVNKIYNHFGLVEIKQITNTIKQDKFLNYKQLYCDGTKIDIFNTKYINEIITNLQGIYKKGYLFLKNNKKIKLYFTKGIQKPQENSHIKILSGHLGIYKSKIQIIIHKQSDFTDD